MRRAFILLYWLILPAMAVAAPVTYDLQPELSDVGFVYRLGGNDMRGSMPVQSADIVIDPKRLERSRVDVSVDVTRARAGMIFATEALKAPSVLNVRDHPMIRFRSTRISLNDQRQIAEGAEIEGELTIRGVTRPVILQAGLYQQAGTEVGDLRWLSVRLTGQIRRSDFGATGYGDLVDDIVTLNIVARIVRAEPSP